MNESRWIALHCGEETSILIERHPNAFLLLTQIAMRAKWKDCPITKLKAGQAFIGDWKEAGLHSEKAYRHAKKVLTDCKLAAFRGANKGTVATLENSTVFSVTAIERGGQTGGQGADEGRARGGQGATNHTDTQNTLTHGSPLSCPEPCPDPNGNQMASELFALTGAGSGSPPKLSWSASDGFSGITDHDRDSWAKAYPAVNLDRQLAAAHEWLLSNPAKARKSNWRRFITAWLSRSQDRGGDVPSNPAASSRFPNQPGKLPQMSLEDATKLLGGRAAGLTDHRRDKQAREYPEPPHQPLPRL